MLLKYNTQTTGYTTDDYWHLVEDIAGADPSQLKFLCSQPEDYTSEVLIALEWLEQECQLITSESDRLEVVHISLKEKNKLSSSYRCLQL
jgi:hypothetical protein